ncbi:MAG: T9SS type A sorting domain-containing protein [Bacteroidia bacterium]
MKKSHLILLWLTCVGIELFCQPFEKIIGATSLIQPCHYNNTIWGVSIEKMNNGFIAFSQTESTDYNCGTIASGYTLTKLNYKGDTIFSSFFLNPFYTGNGGNIFLAQDMTVDIDSNIYVTGEMETDTTRFYVAKHDYNGNLIWYKQIANNYISSPRRLIMDSLSVIVFGKTASSFGVQEKQMIVKLNSNGNLVWKTVIPGSAFCEPYKILSLNNNYYAFSGWLPNAPNNGYLISMTKLDKSGILDSVYLFGNIADSYSNIDAIINYEKNIVVVANNLNFPNNYLFKTDTVGILIRDSVFSNSTGNDRIKFWGIAETTDSNLVIIETKEYPDPISTSTAWDNSISLQKLRHNNYALIWEKEYTNGPDMNWNSVLNKRILALDSNNLIVIGTRILDSNKIEKTLVIKTDQFGDSHQCKLSFWLSGHDSIPVGTNLGEFNCSTGLGPFSWYMNGIFQSSQLNNSFIVNDTGIFVVSLVGCNDTMSVIFTGYVNTNGMRNIVDKEIKSYPNPVNNYLTISSTKMLGDFLISNSIGEVVLRIKSKNQMEKIDVSSLQSGVYIIQNSESHLKFVKY